MKPEELLIATSNPYLRTFSACDGALREHLRAIYGLPSEDESAKEAPAPKEERWIWVDGYKATDRNMQCRGYQYEMWKMHDMPEDTKISVCNSGFHLCPELKQVFSYYSIGDGHRYFKVKALVRESDYQQAKEWNKDKLAAKSIAFTYELTVDEILMGTEAEHFADEFKKYAIEFGITSAKRAIDIKRLVEAGFNEKLAGFIYDEGDTELALALSAQTGVSMDTIVKIVFA